jgi:hypothetical protein
MENPLKSPTTGFLSFVICCYKKSAKFNEMSGAFAKVIQDE